MNYLQTVTPARLLGTWWCCHGYQPRCHGGYLETQKVIERPLIGSSLAFHTYVTSGIRVSALNGGLQGQCLFAVLFPTSRWLLRQCDASIRRRCRDKRADCAFSMTFEPIVTVALLMSLYNVCWVEARHLQHPHLLLSLGPLCPAKPWFLWTMKFLAEYKVYFFGNTHKWVRFKTVLRLIIPVLFLLYYFSISLEAVNWLNKQNGGWHDNNVKKSIYMSIMSSLIFLHEIYYNSIITMISTKHFYVWLL